MMRTHFLQPQVTCTIVKMCPCFRAAPPCQPRVFTHSDTSKSGCNNHRQSDAATNMLTHSLRPAEVMHILLLLHIAWLCSWTQDARQTCANAEISSTTRQLRQGEAVQYVRKVATFLTNQHEIAHLQCISLDINQGTKQRRH